MAARTVVDCVLGRSELLEWAVGEKDFGDEERVCQGCRCVVILYDIPSLILATSSILLPKLQSFDLSSPLR